VTLTLSLAYFSVLVHQRTREHQGLILRTQALALQNVVDPIPATIPPSRREIAAAERSTAVEVVKDRWNHEVENAVRWLQRKDWDQVREGVEEKVAGMWVKTIGEAAEGAEHAKDKAAPLAAKAKADLEKAAKDTERRAAKELTQAEAIAEAKAAQAARATKNQAAEAKLAAKDAAAEARKAADDAAAEGKGLLASAWGKAKSTVGAVGEKTQVPVDGKIVEPMDPVQKALHQRYEKPGPLGPNKTVKEALAERYIPMDQRDNTVLRGI
jgi:altered-inheritance-of-mitochondria protein 5